MFKHDLKPLQVEERIQQLRAVITSERDPLLMAHHIAELQVALSERAEIASQRLEEHTVTLIRFTKWLYWFTGALLLLAVIELVVAFFGRH